MVSITYAAAIESALDEPLPIGMGLRVPLPDVTKVLPPQTSYSALQTRVMIAGGHLQNSIATPPPPTTPIESPRPPVGSDCLCDFDDLDLQQVSHCTCCVHEKENVALIYLIDASISCAIAGLGASGKCPLPLTYLTFKTSIILDPRNQVCLLSMAQVRFSKRPATGNILNER